MTTDSRITTREKRFYSELRTKATNDATIIYNKWPKIESVPKELLMDFSRIVDKPFFVANVGWNAAVGAGGVLATLSIPGSLLASNTLLQKPFNSSCFYRFKLCLSVQVSGTPMHAGTVLVSTLPDNRVPSNVNQLLIAPHAFLSANESSSVCVEVPFYSVTSLRRTGGETVSSPDTANYAVVNFWVINPLLAPMGGTTELTLSVHAIIKDAEFYVPRSFPRVNGPPSFVAESMAGEMYKIPSLVLDNLSKGAKMVTGDIIDKVRATVKAYTGFHNPNQPAISNRMITGYRNFGNAVDQPTFIEKMDQHAQFDRITYDYLFDTDQDEMDMKYILSKPVYLTTVTVSDSTPYGERLFSYPMTPMVEVGNTNPVFYSPLRLFYESSLYWRGGLKLHIQSSMSNFQFCKLLVVRDYDADYDSLFYPQLMQNTLSLMTETLEFSAGGQIQTVSLPYCSTTEQLRCVKDIAINGLLNGIVSIYLLQPLTVNGSLPNTASFNIYFSVDDDFQFYGYANDAFYPLPELPPPPAVSFTAESAQVTIVPGDQKEILNNNEKTEEDHLRALDFKPMVSVRDYIRRMVPVAVRVLPGNTPFTTFDLDLLFAGENSTVATPTLMRGMFYGSTGGMKLKFRVVGSSLTTLKYVPPDYYVKRLFSPNIYSSTAPWAHPQFEVREFLFNPSVGGPLPSSTPYVETPLRTTEIQNGDAKQYITEHEIVVPNMTPFRFISNDHFRNDINIGASAMGHVVMQFAPQTVDQNFIITVYMGATDETRYGQHCFSPGCRVPTFEARRIESDFNQPDDGGPRNEVTIYQGAYYPFI